MTLFGYLNLNTIIFFIFSLVFVLIEKIYRTLKKVIHHIPNSSRFVKNTPPLVIFFKSLPGVLKCGETRPLVFDILLNQFILRLRDVKENRKRKIAARNPGSEILCGHDFLHPIYLGSRWTD